MCVVQGDNVKYRIADPNTSTPTPMTRERVGELLRQENIDPDVARKAIAFIEEQADGGEIDGRIAFVTMHKLRVKAGLKKD
jgi:hypothetical protein